MLSRTSITLRSSRPLPARSGNTRLLGAALTLLRRSRLSTDIVCQRQDVRAVSSLARNASLGYDLAERRDRKTSIICTVGPSTWHLEGLRGLLMRGMNVMRLNFSHGSHTQKAQVIADLRSLLAEIQASGDIDYNDGSREDICAIAADTKGPEIRTGLFGGDLASVALSENDELVLSTNTELMNNGSKDKIFVDYAGLADEVSAEQVIWIDDGLLELKVIEVNPGSGEVRCMVMNNATLGQQKGVNIPFPFVSNLPSVTEQDKADLAFAASQGVDFIFASFIRSGADVKAVRAALGSNSAARIISKIESEEGCKNFDEILEASDGIMVARGDLGIEIPAQQVFVAQKMMLAKCNIAGKPGICATQMLESMVHSPRPTRAEVSDVANAVLDGADAVMLSGETAKGKWPNNAVEVMSLICREAEVAIDYDSLFRELRVLRPTASDVPPSTEAISASAVLAAGEINAAAILVLTSTGKKAQLVAKYRPACPIVAICNDEKIANSLLLHRGIISLYKPHVDVKYDHGSAMVTGMEELESMGLRAPNQQIVCLRTCYHSPVGTPELTII